MKTLARPGDFDDVLRRLRTVRPDGMARWGRMSAHQMICHLGDALRVATGQKTVSAATGPMQRTVIKWIALYLPAPWPAGVPTRPEIDQYVGGTKPQDFARDVAEVESLLRVMTQAHHDPCPMHPIFGPMSRTAWLRWGYLHADHHLRQFGA
jgi:uncharacterized protein DUF1569